MNDIALLRVHQVITFGGAQFLSDVESPEEFAEKFTLDFVLNRISGYLGVSDTVSYDEAVRDTMVCVSLPETFSINDARGWFVSNHQISLEEIELVRKTAIRICDLPEYTLWPQIDDFVRRKIEERMEKK
jgi:hypothetical protein